MYLVRNWNKQEVAVNAEEREDELIVNLVALTITFPVNTHVQIRIIVSVILKLKMRKNICMYICVSATYMYIIKIKMYY